ncbi:MAG: DUF5723 family protein [Paludibacter sp.]|nr:DUF5723 family protein [Paludibacter sp.]
MKKSIINKIILVLCLGFSTYSAKSQQVNTMYFMENVPERNFLNPAFQPLSNFYLGFPVLGYTQFSLGNNSLTLKDFAYKDANGNPIWFMNPNGNKDKFYNALNPSTLIQTNLQINLLDFGFRTGKAYWSFSLVEKAEGQAGIPKDLMKLLLYGTPNMDKNSYDFTSIGADMTLYTEVGLGYSRKVNDKLTVGGKLKLLLGTANVTASATTLKLNAGIDQWNLVGNGSVNYSSPVDLNGNSFDTFNPIKPNSAKDWLKPSGTGGGIDLGATYKVTNNLTVSAAVTDLGFIRWSKNLKKMGYNVNYNFTGLNGLNVNNTKDFKQLTDSVVTTLKNAVKDSVTNNAAYTSYTSPKINIGAEYAFFDNKLSVGLLSRTLIHNSVPYEEVTASINGRPIDWFDMSLSYSVFNGRMSNIGAGLGLRTGFLHWFLSADYIPLSSAKVSFSNNSTTSSYSVPYNTKGMNFAFGVNFVFGNRKDADRDGVIDRKDKCPNTPLGVKVDKKGCPVDADGDGVPDYLDKCPNTPPEAYKLIDQNGCPIDTDGDGVPDYLDKCPDTPKAAFGLVDSKGCPLDTDGDSVPDYMDKCPNTPPGVKVDSVGCPLDSDGDGVPDYLDKCPDTPKAAKGFVDKNGCPLDTDGDGVPDYLDLCPNTPREAFGFIDKNGCTLDTDGDGVPDYLDKCPNTPVEARGKVDQNGCPRDTDGDGIPDYLDNCPTIPGVASNFGCPEIKKEVKTLFRKALQGIQFETGSDLIVKKSYSILNQIAVELIKNPTYLIEIRGHTDSIGDSKSNQVLSQKRAASVRKYLIGKKIDEKRMTVKGFGDTLPIASNKTVAGRKQNRRVEFIVTFEEEKK